MIRIDRVVTRGGDKGETSLGDGTRVPKGAQRIEAIGAVDEANAAIGLVRLHLPPEFDPPLARAQNDLFDLGADLCVPGEGGDRLRVTDAASARLEQEIAAMNAKLPPLTSFVLPAGTPGAVHAHMARTIIRRAERAVARLQTEEPVNSAVLRYLNRLSDHLFVLGRVLNASSAGDVLWVPGANR